MHVARPLLKPSTSSSVTGHVPVYLSLLDEDAGPPFIEALPSYQGFWDLLSNTELTGTTVTIFEKLVTLDSEKGEHARSELNARLEKFNSEKWQQALTGNQAPLALALAMADKEAVPPDYGHELEHALSNSLTTALTNTSIPVDLIARWFSVARTISPSAQQTIFKNLRDVIFGMPEVPGLLNIIVAGNIRFLEQGQFADEADAAVRRVIMPLLDIQPDGREWLREHADETATWVTHADPATREHLGEKLADKYGTLGEPGDSSIKVLADKWKLTDALRSPDVESVAASTSETPEAKS